jgi:hypothetical protein
LLAESSGSFVRVPIRSIQVVIDLEDPLAPELTLDDFIRTYGVVPASPRYRVLSVEVLTCPEDQLPILASECGHCTRFVRRMDDVAYFRRENSSDSIIH